MEMVDWRVLSARISVFVTPDTVFPASLWRDLMGDDPEQVNVQRALGIKTESGPLGEGTMSLQYQPMRIDCLYQPSGLSTENFGDLPDIGPFPSAIEPLRRLFVKWVESSWFPSARRIALGLVLNRPTVNREAAYQELSHYIEGVPESADASDFQYQINRPRPSRAGIDGLILNRLSKWSAVEFHIVTQDAMGTGAMRQAWRTAVRLELDVNTDGQFEGLISQKQTEPVLADLFAGANEVSEPRTPLHE